MKRPKCFSQRSRWLVVVVGLGHYNIGGIMQWIRNNKIRLSLVCGVTFGVSLIELFIFKTKAQGASIERWQLVLFALSFTVCFFTFLPLWYLAWFHKPQRIAIRAILRLFFWLIAAAMTCLLFQVWTRLIFHLW
jgi:hypothetical protein